MSVLFINKEIYVLLKKIIFTLMTGLIIQDSPFPFGDVLALLGKITSDTNVSLPLMKTSRFCRKNNGQLMLLVFIG
jgi:hypothetical protein